MVRPFAAVGLSFLIAAQAPAQNANPLDSLIAANVSTFTLADGKISGAGADRILAAAAATHFVALGENHNTRAIPLLTTALFRELHAKYGFNYLALEEGPAIGRAVSDAVRRGQPGAAFQLGLRYPNAFHMYTEDELRMIDDIAAISTAKQNPIWGLNQEYGMMHVLERLVQIAPNATAKAIAEAQLARAREYESERFALNKFFMSEVAQPADYRALRDAYKPAPDSEAFELISQAELSNAIFAPYAVKPRAPFTQFYASGKSREDNMKRLFASNYKIAAREAPAPKVLVKSGHVHLNRGIGRSNEVFTLGNFLNELAIFEGGESLHLYVLLNWPDLRQSFLAPFVPHIQANTNTVFDLRPLQAWAAHRQLPQLDPELRRALVGY
ncbi:MAG TPA: hypothetical protein VFZ04_17600, partial [Longimicrobiales bacterium]